MGPNCQWDCCYISCFIYKNIGYSDILVTHDYNYTARPPKIKQKKVINMFKLAASCLTLTEVVRDCCF